MTQRRLENSHVHFWTFSPVSVNLVLIAIFINFAIFFLFFLLVREQTRLKRPSPDEEICLGVDPHAGPRTLEILPYGTKDHKEISESVSRGKFK